MADLEKKADTLERQPLCEKKRKENALNLLVTDV